jgi:phage terminase Nu1 subunit (DNA packaging protein)
LEGNLAKTKETAKKTAVKKPITAAKEKTPAERKPVENKAALNDSCEKRSTMTTDEVAKYLGVTNARISQLKRDGVIAPLPSGSRKEGDFYKPLETFIKTSRYYRELSDSRGSRETEEMKKARERQMIARAKKEELALLGVEGELHRTEDIEHVMGMVLTRLRINLLAIPKGVAPQIIDLKDTNVIAEKIYERICRALNEVVNLDLDELLAKKE